MNESELEAAHEAARYNRDILAHDSKCGCFYCLKIFSPTEINEWCPELEDDEVTALCPHCGIDTVIGESSGFPITKEFFHAMHNRWFGEDDYNARPK